MATIESQLSSKTAIAGRRVIFPRRSGQRFSHSRTGAGSPISPNVLYGLPITTLIFRNYFANIPDELMEAARIDGAGIIRTYTNVMLPLSLPGFVVVGIFQFTNIWNDFLFGVTILQTLPPNL